LEEFQKYLDFPGREIRELELVEGGNESIGLNLIVERRKSMRRLEGIRENFQMLRKKGIAGITGLGKEGKE
jgi:hypothetical protein